jgi:hypothetical protein
VDLNTVDLNTVDLNWLTKNSQQALHDAQPAVLRLGHPEVAGDRPLLALLRHIRARPRQCYARTPSMTVWLGEALEQS